MANAFSKEERVAFEQMLEGFEDGCILSKNVSIYNNDMTEMERAGDIIWRPQPYIAQTFSGSDASANFKDFTQLSVPATIGFRRHSAWRMDALQLRDAMQEGRLLAAARQRLESDINQSVMDVAANQSTLVIKRTTAAVGFDDIAQADAIFNEQGVAHFDRTAAFSSRDYNNMAKDLAQRGTMTGKPTTAYEKAYVGNIASFDTFKLDYANRLLAASGTSVTVNGANQYYTPRAVSVATTGETANVDNRYQTINLTVGGGTVRAGDAFVFAGVNACHHITKGDTGQLKTFRIISQVSGSAGGTGAYIISPPIISGGGNTDAELAYKNVTATPANGAALTFLNTATTSVNPFWQKDAIELLPGRLAIDTATPGASIMKAATTQGIQVVLQKTYNLQKSLYEYRVDTLFGVCHKQPEMAGIILFSQV